MARGIWKGTLGFGLVSIGVELFSAEAPTGLDLTMLDARDNAPIGYRKYNKRTGEELDGVEIVKGYPVATDQYVILSPEDLKAANPRAAGTIDILGFVREGDIDLAYFDTPYVVGPLKGSEKAYALFVKALEETERVGIAQVVIRTKQHIAAIYPYRQAIMVHLMRYDEELRQPSYFGIEEGTEARRAIRPQELSMAEKLVESMTTTWDPSQYRDRYRDDLLALIEQRAASAGAGVWAADDDGPPARVLDLMTALKGSLAARARSGAGIRTEAHVVKKRSSQTASTARDTTKRSAKSAEKRPKAGERSGPVKRGARKSA